jgi:hypothetical protein
MFALITVFLYVPYQRRFRMFSHILFTIPDVAQWFSSRGSEIMRNNKVLLLITDEKTK